MNITGGKLNSRTIETANFENVKPTLAKIREAVFNTLSSLGKFHTFADLCAGSGIMSFEAISRGFDVVAVELHRPSASLIKKNAEKLNVDLQLFVCDTLKFLKKTERKFDVIYIDPPYFGNLYEKILDTIYDKNLLAPQGVVAVEKPSELNFDISNFEIVKTKSYGKKTLIYLQRPNSSGL